MNIEQTFIKDLVILTPKNIEDERGCFWSLQSG
jgi:dTDP-4-dehydrorhamnose 3,5-epimerase-like enzyme